MIPTTGGSLIIYMKENPVSESECGGCSATCTSGNLIRFSLRELHILIKRGENDQVRKNIKKCMLCGKCTLVCPRGVNTRNIVVLAKQAFQKFDNYAI
jgi:heterodisulfide reductase subunit C